MEILCLKARLIPSIAVLISVTVTMPMTIPIVVKAERILFASSAASEIRIPSMISVPIRIKQRGHEKPAHGAALRRSRSNHREYEPRVLHAARHLLHASQG